MQLAVGVHFHICTKKQQNKQKQQTKKQTKYKQKQSKN